MKKRVTIKDVAAQAGVTYQTVSKVINGRAQVMPETEARILAASLALGYKPNHSARSLRAQRSQMIGYSWVPTGRNQTNHILDMFLSSMVEEAEAAGYHLLPFPYREGDDQVNAYRELIDSGRVDGFVLSSVNYRDPRIRFCSKTSSHLSPSAAASPQDSFPFVDVNGETGPAAGHRAPARSSATGALPPWPGPKTRAWATSACRAIPPPCAAPGRRSTRPGWSAAKARSNLGWPPPAPGWPCRPSRRPTAVVALNDTMAIGAMHAAQNRGALPGRQFSVVGFDNSPMAQYLWPPLTSVSQPIRLAGRKCVEMLVALAAPGRPCPSGVCCWSPN